MSITYTPIENDKLEATCSLCGTWFGDKLADGNTYTDDYVISLSYQEHKAQYCAGLCE